MLSFKFSLYLDGLLFGCEELFWQKEILFLIVTLEDDLDFMMETGEGDGLLGGEKRLWEEATNCGLMMNWFKYK